MAEFVCSKYMFVISVNDNELAVTPGDFCRLKNAGKFVSCHTDINDFAKIIGITADSKIYVSEKLDSEMTDEETEAYYARFSIEGESVLNMIKRCSVDTVSISSEDLI